MRPALSAAVIALGMSFASGAAAGTCDDLVRVGRSMEASGDPDRALRAYNDALSLEPTCRDAYLRLGAIREARHDYREAERVYSTAIDHVPAAREPILRRAAVRLLMGLELEGLAELRALGEAEPEDEGALRVAVDALRRLDDWFSAHDQVAARLGVWRRVLVLADRSGDGPLLAQARTMSRALTLVVGPADPVTQPNGAGGLRFVIARSAR